MATVKPLYALKAYYRVVYLNGLGVPVETVIGASNELDENDCGILDQVCLFIQQGIDLDCRRVLFFYQEELINE